MNCQHNERGKYVHDEQRQTKLVISVLFFDALQLRLPKKKHGKKTLKSKTKD